MPLCSTAFAMWKPSLMICPAFLATSTATAKQVSRSSTLAKNLHQLGPLVTTEVENQGQNTDRTRWPGMKLHTTLLKAHVGEAVLRRARPLSSEVNSESLSIRNWKHQDTYSKNKIEADKKLKTVVPLMETKLSYGVGCTNSNDLHCYWMRLRTLSRKIPTRYNLKQAR